MNQLKEAIGKIRSAKRSGEPALEFNPPARRISPFALASSPGVLVLLDIVTGLELSPAANTEAVLGFLAELKVEGGMLKGSSGKPVTVKACLGFLAHLGADTGEPLPIRDCLQLCEQSGISTKHPTGLAACFRDLIHGAHGQLDRHISTLEARGYRLRQSTRLFNTCHVVKEETVQPVMVTGRLFTRPMLPVDLTIAA